MTLGGDPNGQPFHVYCYEEWKAKYGDKPPWFKKDYSILAAVLKVVGSEDRARAAWDKYIASSDPFYEGHSPGKFVFSINLWTARAKPPRERRDKMEEDEKTLALRKIHNEVKNDASIPEDGKRSEASKRFREMFPDGA